MFTLIASMLSTPTDSVRKPTVFNNADTKPEAPAIFYLILMLWTIAVACTQTGYLEKFRFLPAGLRQIASAVAIRLALSATTGSVFYNS